MKANYILFVLFFIFLAVSLYQKYQSDKIFATEMIYVVGEIVERRTPSKGSDVLVYEYFYKGEKFRKERTAWYRGKINKKFIVAIPIKHSDTPFLLLEYPVPDHIESPKLGWKEIPEFIEKVDRPWWS